MTKDGGSQPARTARNVWGGMPGMSESDADAGDRAPASAPPATTLPVAPTPVAPQVAADARTNAPLTTRPANTTVRVKRAEDPADIKPAKASARLKKAKDPADASDDQTPQRPFRLQCNVTVRADALVEAGKQALRQRGLRGHDASITVVVENALEIAYGSLIPRGRR